MVNSIEKEIKYKKLAGKLAFYIFFIFFFIDKNVSENVSDEIKTFALSYAVTDMFIFFSSKVKNIKIPNCVFVIAIGVNIMLMFFFRKDQKFDIYFSYFFFLIILIAFIIPSIKIKPFKILKLSSDKKLMLFSYIVYTTILVIIKCIFNNLGIPIKNIIHINVNYIEYQLIVCTVYLDKLKDMYSLTLIGGTKEEIREFEKIVEKTKIIDNVNSVSYLKPGLKTVSRIPSAKYLGFMPLNSVSNFKIIDAKYPLTLTDNVYKMWSSNEFVSNMVHVSFDTGVIMVTQTRDKT